MMNRVLLLTIVVLLVIQMAYFVESRPQHAMTRIQEVFRSLAPPNEPRGKKYFSQQYWVPEDENDW